MMNIQLKKIKIQRKEDEDDEHVHLIFDFFIFLKNIFKKIKVSIFLIKKWEKWFICAFMKDKRLKWEKR